MTAERTEMNSDHGIEWRVDDAVARIVLNRPEQSNALGPASGAALARAIDAVTAAAPRVIVIAARGPIFCAGGDIREFAAAGDRLPELVSESLESLLPAYLKLANQGAPIISAVRGPVGGAGIGLALAGDFVLASPAMKLRTGYAAIGLSPDVGASYFLARRVGAVRAQQLLMTSETVSAERCLVLGAIDQLHDEADFDAAVEMLVQRLRAAAPASLAAIKRLCGGAAQRTLAEHLVLERELLEGCARTADAREGVSAFVAHRAPRFEGP
jgi:2-(1,2-epoxy-1,2-dihydrophenyl)acetyl-CoA isomerase